MYDRRFPNLEPVERASMCMGVVDAARVRRAVKEISNRTGTRGFYNIRNHTVLFVYGDEPHGGPMALPLTDRPITQAEIDSAVEYIQLGKVGRAQKDRWASRQAEREKWDHQDGINRHLAERRPDAISYAAHLDQKRRGVQRLVSVGE